MIQNSSVLFLKQTYFHLYKGLHTSSCLGNHYETLKLKKNCTAKDIKDSFIKLSKENHPDLNKHPNAHKEFQKIQEAYSVLGKQQSRARYDFELPFARGSRFERTNAYDYGPRSGYGTWNDPSFWHNRPKPPHDPNEAYYGIKGIKKQTNATVALIIAAFALAIVGIQITVIRHAFARQQDSIKQRSIQNQHILNQLKEKSQRTGNKAQIEIHRRQFEESERLRLETVSHIK